MNTPNIRVDDRGVRQELANGLVASVTWDELVEVSIQTTCDGPFAQDVFFLLQGQDGTGCVAPQDAPESAALLERLQRLPGFDNQAVIRAMSSSEENKFLCWRRPPADR